MDATGLRRLDQLAAGLCAGSLIAIAGRPSSGKSLLAYQVADHIARVAKRAVLVVCAQDSAARVARRITCMQTGVWPMAFVDDPEQRTLESLRAFATLASVPMLLDDTSSLQVGEIVDRLVRFAANRGVPLGAVIVDDPFPVLVGESGNIANIETIGQLRDRAGAIGVPVIVTVKVNRFVERRRNHRPRLSDFNKTYSPYVQAADIVLALYRDDIYDADSPDVGVVEVASLTNRFGNTGVARLRFGRYRFEDL